MNTKMTNGTNKYLKLALMGTAAILTAIGVSAQTWEQELNFSLSGEVQTTPGTVKKAVINNKTLLALLSNLNLMETNNYTLFRTNSPTHPEPLPAAPFPAVVAVSDNYGACNLYTGQFVTNNVDFRHVVIFTRTSTSPVTYVFTNIFDINGMLGSFLADFPAFIVTAVLVDPNGPVYSVSGGVPFQVATPAFSPKAKLVVYHDPVSGSDQFLVRDPGSSDADVSPLFSLEWPQRLTQSQAGGSALVYSTLHLTFDNTIGDKFDLQGFATGMDSVVNLGGNGLKSVTKSVAATVVGSGAAASASLPAGSMVLSGRVTLTGGRPTPAQ